MQEKTKINLLIIALGISALIIILMFRGTIETDAFKNVVTSKDTAYIENIKGILANYNKSIVLDSEKQLKLIVQQNDTLRKIIAKIKNVTNTIVIKERVVIEKDTIPFTDSIPCNFKPIKAIKNDKWYAFFGTVNNKGLIIDSLHIPNTQSVVMGEKKTNFWGKSEQGVYIVNSNPLIKTQTIQHLTVVEKKKWYQRPILWFGTGALATITGILIFK